MILQKWQGIEDSGLENSMFGVTQEMIVSNGLNSSQEKKINLCPEEWCIAYKLKSEPVQRKYKG